MAYNRFRYYDVESGNYISQDPIGLLGNNPTLYGYVKDINFYLDFFGLDPIIVNPRDINYSQRTVQEVRVFDASKYEPIRVMDVNGQMITYDNGRLLSAQNAGLDKIEIELVDGKAPFPASSTGRTWEQNLQKDLMTKEIEQ